MKQKRHAYNRSAPSRVTLSNSHSSVFNFRCFVCGLLCTGVVVAGCATGMPASTSSGQASGLTSSLLWVAFMVWVCLGTIAVVGAGVNLSCWLRLWLLWLWFPNAGGLGLVWDRAVGCYRNGYRYPVPPNATTRQSIKKSQQLRELPQQWWEEQQKQLLPFSQQLLHPTGGICRDLPEWIRVNM